MSNIQNMRAQLRGESGSEPSSPGLGRSIAVGLAACAVISAGAYVLFLKPVIVPLRPSAAIPTFQHVQSELGTPQVQSPFVPTRGEVERTAAQIKGNYAGLSPRQTGTAADEVCFARAHARHPLWSKTPRLTTKELHDFAFDAMPHFNELMHCLLTEAPTRYCSSSQRGMISAETSMYFRGLEYGNKGLAKVRAQVASAPGPGNMARYFMDPAEINRINRLEYVADQRVLAGIEARLADATLTKADRESFSAAAPQPIRQRLANVKPAAAACPTHPWWAFWRGF